MLTREEQETEVQKLNALQVAQQEASGTIAVGRAALPAFEVAAIKAKIEEYRMRMDAIKQRYEALLAKRDEVTLDIARDVQTLGEEALELDQNLKIKFVTITKSTEEARLFSNLNPWAFYDLVPRILKLSIEFYKMAAIAEEKKRKEAGCGCSVCQRHLHGGY
jgi:hypothetical protein